MTQDETSQNDQDHSDRADRPPNEHRSSGWNAVWFTLKAIEIRLRFVAVLVGIGLVIGYWDTIQNYWDKWTRPPADASSGVASGEEFYCPMHPSVVRDTLDAGGAVPKCPICGMPLSKRKQGQAEPLAEGVLSRVQFSPYRISLAGIETAEVAHRPLTLSIRAPGYVALDERNLARIVVRAAGYVEKLHVNETFATVRAGQPLAEIYSPELYTAAQELLIAQRGQNVQLLAVAREKLALLGVAVEEIDQISHSGEARLRLVIRAPHGGHVFQKNIVEGDHVVAGQMLFEVADLSTVWIEGELYEQDAGAVERGQSVQATVEAYPGRLFEGRVHLVHPHVESATRTLRVRCELDNPNHDLRPGMFATLTFSTPLIGLEPFRSLRETERRETALAHQVAKSMSEQSGDTLQVPQETKNLSQNRPQRGGQAHFTPKTPQNEPVPDGSGIGSKSDLQSLADLQQKCPVTGLKLGSMGDPIAVAHEGRAVLLCCAACAEKFHARPKYYVDRMRRVTDDGTLAIPELSVIDTGDQQVAYIERTPGVFEGVAVTLGPRAGGYYAVIDGVLAGDRVAAAGAFLIDAETRLNPSTSATYFGASGSSKHNH